MGKEKTDKRLHKVLSHAAVVFGDWDKARKWADTAHPLLDGKTPNEVAAVGEGVKVVDKILTAIEYGVYK